MRRMPLKRRSGLGRFEKSGFLTTDHGGRGLTDSAESTCAFLRLVSPQQSPRPRPPRYPGPLPLHGCGDSVPPAASAPQASRIASVRSLPAARFAGRLRNPNVRRRVQRY